ncbi:MAG: hypothetical protein LBS21_15560 [Clostridiales bacterium]|jgi:hypothetical protein|nr:hypothetical protein [Clostridiales bacterium]
MNEPHFNTTLDALWDTLENTSQDTSNNKFMSNSQIIFVYNEEVNGMEMFEEDLIQKANGKFDPFKINDYEKIWFKSVHTYSKKIFESNFVKSSSGASKSSAI